MSTRIIPKRIDREFRGSSFNGPDDRTSSGIAHLIIPIDVVREDYIKRVFATSRCMVLTTFDNPIVNAIIPSHILADLQFPELPTERGSLIFWNNIPFQNQIVIMGVIPEEDEFSQMKEGQRVDKYNFQNFTQTDIISSEDNTRLISVTDESGDEGEIMIKASGSDKSSIIKIDAKGNVKIYSDNETKLFSENEVLLKIGSKKDEITILNISKEKGMEYKDRFGNKVTANSTGVIIDTENKVSIKNKNESLMKLLRDTLTMYLQTKTIDGKVLDPTSLNKATQLIQRNNKLFF